jgi:cytochrome c553
MKSAAWALVPLLFFLLSTPADGEDLLARGKKIAREGNGVPGNIACMECHRLDGGGMPSIGSPRISGQTALYIEHEIHGVQNGSRYAPIMSGVLQPLTDRDIRAVALYYSNLRSPKRQDVSPPDPSLVKTGERIALRGLWKKNIPACVQCHGPEGRGIPPHFPYLAGQNKGYLLRQLVSFAFLKRKDDPQGLMRGIARRLTPRERKAVAEYFSSLNPPTDTEKP